MRGFLAKITRVSGWVGADAEVTIIAIFAVLLLILGPPVAAFYFLGAHHYAPAIVTSGVWILGMISCERDFRREHFGLVTAVLCCIWFITTVALVIIYWRLEAI